MDVTTSLTLIIVTAFACGTFIWWRTTTLALKTAASTAETVVAPLKTVAASAATVANAFAERLRKKDDYDRIQLEVAKLREEIAEARAHKPSPSLIEPIMQLALIEIPFDHMSVKKYTLNEEREGWLSRESTTEYLGIFEAKYRKKFGVDLKALRFELRGKKIAVTGLTATKMLGALSIEITPWLTEVREHCKEGSIRNGSSVILTDGNGNGRTEEERKQYKGILDQINSSGHLETSNAVDSVNDMLQNMALGFLQACFAPSGYEVIKDDTLSAAISFSQLCHTINEIQDDHLRGQEQFLQQKLQKLALLEADLIDLPRS